MICTEQKVKEVQQECLKSFIATKIEFSDG